MCTFLLTSSVIEPAGLVHELPPVQNLSTAWLEQAFCASSEDYRGGCFSPHDDSEFFPIASLLLAGSVVVAFHLQSPKSLHKFTLPSIGQVFHQPYRLWTCHWIHFSEAHFFRNIVNILTHGILCERTLGVVDFLEATLWALLVTSLCGTILLHVGGDKFALAHAQGVGFSTVVCFWMGLAFATPTAPWWHRFWCFLGIVIADVLMYTNKERGTLHHWIGVNNGLLYAFWKQNQKWPKTSKNNNSNNNYAQNAIRRTFQN